MWQKKYNILGKQSKNISWEGILRWLVRRHLIVSQSFPMTQVRCPFFLSICVTQIFLVLYQGTRGAWMPSSFLFLTQYHRMPMRWRWQQVYDVPIVLTSSQRAGWWGQEDTSEVGGLLSRSHIAFSLLSFISSLSPSFPSEFIFHFYMS